MRAFCLSGVSRSDAASDAAFSGGASRRPGYARIRRALQESFRGRGRARWASCFLDGCCLLLRPAAARILIRRPCGAVERPFLRLRSVFRVSGSSLVMRRCRGSCASPSIVATRVRAKRAKRTRGNYFEKKFKFPLDSRFRIRIINSRTARKGNNPKARNPIRGLSSAGRAHGWQP